MQVNRPLGWCSDISYVQYFRQHVRRVHCRIRDRRILLPPPQQAVTAIPPGTNRSQAVTVGFCVSLPSTYFRASPLRLSAALGTIVG